MLNHLHKNLPKDFLLEIAPNLNNGFKSMLGYPKD